MSKNERDEAFAEDFISSNPGLPLSLDGILFHYSQEPVKRPNGVPFYQWMQCISGTGEVILDDQKIIVREGRGILLKAHIPHSYYGTTDQWITHNISFSGSACEQILNGLGMKQSGVYQVTNLDITKKFVKGITIHQKTKGPCLDRIYSKELYTFLLDLSYDIQRIHISEPAMENKILRIVDQYLIDHFNQPVSLDILAELVDLRKEYLCTLFKKHMQQTISQHLQIIRIAHAKYYLVHYPEKTVKEIGVLCGFESTSYFCKVFKKIIGYSPDEYRRLH
ncbi:MAG TPA: AraC family transcriptional regulator [Clostridiales bacterium]|nr:AraC family transcriptional regulator [Clostridiales bacterium]